MRVVNVVDNELAIWLPLHLPCVWCKKEIALAIYINTVSLGSGATKQPISLGNQEDQVGTQSNTPDPGCDLLKICTLDSSMGDLGLEWYGGGQMQISLTIRIGKTIYAVKGWNTMGHRRIEKWWLNNSLLLNHVLKESSGFFTTQKNTKHCNLPTWFFPGHSGFNAVKRGKWWKI